MSGHGQGIDAAMVDGVNVLAQSMFGLRAIGEWTDDRASNLLDSGAPFYDTYECSDGKFVSVGAIESQFYEQLLTGMGIDPAALPDQNDRSSWPATKKRFARVFRTRSRDDWVECFESYDACFAPVLTFAEASEHPHMRSRATHVRVGPDDVVVSPASRISRTDAARDANSFASPKSDTQKVLASWA